RVVPLLGEEGLELHDLGKRGGAHARVSRLKPRLGSTAEAAMPRRFTGKRRAASSLATLTPSPPLRCSGRRRPCLAVLSPRGALAFSVCPSPPARAARAGRSWRSSAGSARGRQCARSATARRAWWGAAARRELLPGAAAPG